jgi:hypothetical protein
MKRFAGIVSLFFCLGLSAQEKNKVAETSQFTVTGAIKQEKIITLSDLSQMPAQTIGSVMITNHTGAERGVAKDMKGVLLKEVLKDIVFAEETPKKLSEFYLTCMASDGYKVVLSWNELFNNESGNNLFIVTEKAGKRIQDMEENILLISPKDFTTGRRYIKGLQKIIVGRVN